MSEIIKPSSKQNRFVVLSPITKETSAFFFLTVQSFHLHFYFEIKPTYSSKKDILFAAYIYHVAIQHRVLTTLWKNPTENIEKKGDKAD